MAARKLSLPLFSAKTGLSRPHSLPSFHCCREAANSPVCPRLGSSKVARRDRVYRRLKRRPERLAHHF